MDSRPVFVLLTAKNCHACHNFKRKTWEDLKAELNRQNRVKVVHVEVETTLTKPDPVKYHPELREFIGWYPTMSLFPANRWYDHSSELIGIIKNGKISPPTTDENGNEIPQRVEIVGKINLSKEDIIKWVNYTLDNDKIFKSSQPRFLKDNKGNYIVPTTSAAPKYYASFRPTKVE